MTTFQSINMSLVSRDYTSEATTPTTPRAPIMTSPRLEPAHSVNHSGPTTPTNNTFTRGQGQDTLPSSSYEKPFPPPLESSSKSRHGVLSRESSHRSVQSTGSQDVDMDESDDEEDGSDGDSIDGETGRPSKKKKGQRFFCTEFPPCNLSFTRSEHLARHIRKHTGERPFQCHCARRFSRLDNLRQHAQTVHVNEEIPGDSLAATGTRFQRQIRTDRVRPPVPRSRASTASSQGSHGRGHSRNLSSSSIGSNASTISRDDNRRRPTPLIMAHDSSPRSRLTIDTMRGQISTPPGSYAYPSPSPGGPSTPASTCSNGPSSPFGSSLGSPISTHAGLWGSRTPGRRLSVPSSGNSFQSSHNHTYPPAYLNSLAPSSPSNNSINSSAFASPTSSTYSFGRSEIQTAAEADLRRRTWHPSTYSTYPRPATSGLSYYQTPDAPRPAFAPQAVTAVNHPQRLPGIETFDQMTNRPKSPPRPGPRISNSDMMTKPQILPGHSEQQVSGPNDRRGHASWDMSLHQNLTKLDIANGTPPKDAGYWGKQTIDEIQNAASNSAFAIQQQARSHIAATTNHSESQKRPSEVDHYPQPITTLKSKRSGWYNGPLQATQQATLIHRTSPEDSSSSDGVPTPSASTTEYHPSIVHSNGYIEANYAGSSVSTAFHGHSSIAGQPPSYADPSRNVTLPGGSDMSGLEALVAAATSEGKAHITTHHE